MKHKLLILCAFCFYSLLSQANTIAVVPQPQKYTSNEGIFTFDDRTVLIAPLSTQRQATEILVKLLRRSAEIKLHEKKHATSRNYIRYTQANNSKPESYRLSISKYGIDIEAGDAAGYLYATQTLLQLMPAQIYNESENKQVSWSVPCVTIDDAPRFPYRGFMLDVSRYFLPKEHIITLLDYLALHKINKFHWHLVDDNGWRIEIKKYPKLQSIGAYRQMREALFPQRANPEPGEPSAHGGYYSQQDVKEIVAYAMQRNIEVIPEIEMPAHTNSSLAAYPNLACPVTDTKALFTLPGIGGNSAANIYCAGNEEVFTFLQDVIDEIIPLFPSPYIHIGGDEATKTNWEKCPLCQKRMHDNNIPNEEELQSYFMRRMSNYIISHGKNIMGWDELVDSEIPKDATIFGWRGNGEAAVKAAQKGHNIILTPAIYFYLIRYQGPQWFEPYTYFGNNTLKDVYQYDPAMSKLPDDCLPQLLGMQASMWTEFIYSWENLQYMIFPRLAAFADNAWSSHKKDWNGFLTRLDHLTSIYDNTGITYSHSMFNLFHEVRASEKGMQVGLSCLRPDVEIRYSTDSQLPHALSPLYTDTIIMKPGDQLIANTFCKGVAMGSPLHINSINHKGVGATIKGLNGLGYRLSNGLLGSERYTDGEYIDFYDKNASFVVDLKQETDISEIVLHTMINFGMATTYPANISICISSDNVNFTPLCQKEYTPEMRFPSKMMKGKIIINDFALTRGRYLKWDITKPGNIPSGHIREGSPSRMVFDEIAIY